MLFVDCFLLMFCQSAYDEDDDGEGPMGGQGMQCAQQ